MKKNDNTHMWITKTIVIISLGISVWALIIANSDYPLIFDENKVITFAGLLFTVIGTVFAFYFLIIGLDANKKKDKIKELDNEIEKKQSQIERFERMGTNQLDIMYGHLIYQAQKINDTNERNKVILSLQRDRARLGTQSIFLPEERRLQRMSELGAKINNQLLGEASDIKDLQRIINDPSENPEIIKIAKEVKDTIEKNLEN